jgi:hypothetical protein
MVLRTPEELRVSAARLREMASEGSDPELQAALRLVADELEREAADHDRFGQTEADRVRCGDA